jgi:hypothetical protein
MVNAAAATTVKAIQYSEDARSITYMVMAAHAGRSDRTGAKVHMAHLTFWKESGRYQMGATNCSGNGQLRGSLVRGRDFGSVSCAKCGASVEAADARNSKAIDLVVP